MPIDWGAVGVQAPGVEGLGHLDSRPAEQQKRIRTFTQTLRGVLKDTYSIGALEDHLFRHGQDLRE